jgi:predicted Zn-dependent protease|uniref:Tetratricopeptide repeat protein n=1 Tax=Desulfobacca acetoxidans TaxID=60893 RepID=A0A7V6A5D8_9BACT
MMKKPGSWRQIVWLLIFTLLWGTTPAVGGLFSSLSTEKERELGEEFFLELNNNYPICTDPFVSSYINRLGHKLEAQLPPHPFKYRFYVLDDPSMNAFAVPGGYVFMNSGFIRLMDKEGELAGVLAHEISHIYARHMARMLDESKPVSIATLVGSLAAVLLGGPAAAALLVGSQAAGQAAMLKYSRDHEQEADDLGFKWLQKAGYDPRDMILAFKKLNKQRWYAGGQPPIYLSTHPHTDTRLVELANRLNMHADVLPKDHDNQEFQYFALKVDSLSGSPYQLLRRMTQAAIHEPNNPAYLYGKALALAKMDHPDEAMGALEQGLKLDPGNYFIRREMAIQYFERNRYQQALSLFQRLAQTQPHDETVLYYLGRIYQEQRQFADALSAMERVQSLNPAFVEVYQNLGTLYGEEGQLGLAHYYLGLHSLTSRALPTALFHFRKALVNLPLNDPHYARVKDQIARLEKMKVKVN